MACMKHVGLNVAADPLYTAGYTGVNGGLVLCVADDPGLYSSQNEQDTRNHARASCSACIEPSDSQEAKDFMKFASYAKISKYLLFFKTLFAYVSFIFLTYSSFVL